MAAPTPLTRVGARQARSAQSGRSGRPAKVAKPARPAKTARPPRSTTLAGATVPATAAAALSLVATGVGVAAGLDGAAVAQSQATEPDASAALALATVRDVGAAPRDVALAVAERHQQAVLQASRNQARAELAQAALLKTQAAHRWVLPVRTYVKTSGFGMRWGKLHAGEDFAAPIGTPVHAISSGVVVFAGVQQGYGNKIEIRHWDGTCSWYGHLSKIDVKVGQKVDPGELIGLVGNTGHSTGPHLHLEIHPHGDGPVDPLPWLRAHGLTP
jgi:murein DD-endopeptidase MepM/ murein hydrolase activator NlpD